MVPNSVPPGAQATGRGCRGSCPDCRSSCEFAPSGKSSIKVYESSPAGEQGRLLTNSFDMGPFEVRTVNVK